MRTTREILYQELIVWPQFSELVDDRFFQAVVVETAPAEKPFAMYTMSTEGVSGQYVLRAKDRNFQIWAHDEGGDYSRIDKILEAAREALLRVDPELGFLEFRWISRSPDLADPALGTICRFDRWMAVGF